MKQIPLTQGQFAIVDDADYDYLSQFSWQAFNGGGVYENYYAVRHIRIGERWTSIRMHREILGVTDPNVHVDHMNHDTLDNRRFNLRLCTNVQNQANRRSVTGSGSRFKGVVLRRDLHKWASRIGYNGEVKQLGTYDSEEDAARAYNVYANRLYGEFAYLNDVEGWEEFVVDAPPRNPSSLYYGVHWRILTRRWLAVVRVNGRRVCIGSFIDERVAAAMYNVGANRLLGDEIYVLNDIKNGRVIKLESSKKVNIKRRKQ